jgi:hypothetical protein
VPARKEEEILKVLEDWDRNPQQIYEWRADVFKRLILELENMALYPKGTAGRMSTTQLKAIAQLQSMLVALEDVRLKIPVVCPACQEKFTI